MPKKRKSTKQREDDANTEVADRKQPIEALDAMNDLKKSWPADVDSIFSVDMEQQRRQELWEMVRHEQDGGPPAHGPMKFHHGYWAYCMQQRGIECDAYDMFPPVTSSNEDRTCWTTVHRGGPEVLRESSHARKTLLLSYPDDFEESDASMAAECLEALQADTVVHCGELFGDCPMLDKAPWGRTSGAAFQQHLFSLFRCVLKVPLPSWPHCNDHLTVWRRLHTCSVRLPASEGDASPAAAPAASSDSSGDGAGEPGAPVGSPRSVPRAPDVLGAAGASPLRPAAVAESPGRQHDDGAGQAGQGCSASESSDADDADVEFVCDFRRFALSTEQPARGWAIPPLLHLL